MTNSSQTAGDHLKGPPQAHYHVNATNSIFKMLVIKVSMHVHTHTHDKESYVSKETPAQDGVQHSNLSLILSFQCVKESPGCWNVTGTILLVP